MNHGKFSKSARIALKVRSQGHVSPVSLLFAVDDVSTVCRPMAVPSHILYLLSINVPSTHLPCTLCSPGHECLWPELCPRN